MPSITVKNIPVDLYDLLKRRAEANHRSINSEIIVCIEEAIHSQSVDLSESPADAHQLREKPKGYRIVEADLPKALLGAPGLGSKGERKEAFYRLVAEIVEDLLLANAIQEGEGTEDVSREEIYQILGGEP